MILVDTGGLYAALDANEPLHAAAARALMSARPPRLLSPFVLAELDYLVGKRIGPTAQAALLDEVARGAYRLERFEPEDVAAARDVIARYADLRIGLADASVVVLADRYGVTDVLGTDERHFRALRAGSGRPFRLLPADAATR